MLKRGDHGEVVCKLQTALILLGYPLPRWGVDGRLGSETLDAFGAWHAGFGAADPDEYDAIPDNLLNALMVEADYRLKGNPFFSSELLFDVRDDAWTGAEKGQNPIARIDTICLHQMAVKDSDYQGWDRWRKLAIHWVVTCGHAAAAYLLHDLDTYLWHGHGWNRRSVGFEFEGWFSGIGIEERYFWQPRGACRTPMVPTDRQVTAGCLAIRETCQMLENMGGKIKYIGAHRQSYGVKESDPGSLIWQLVALPMMEELGLSEAPTLERGSPIPEAWDPRNKGVPYR